MQAAIKTCSTGSSWPLKLGQIGYPKTSEQNYHLMLRTIPEDSKSQNLFNFSVSFHQENAKWWNVNVFCDITSKNVYKGEITTSRVKQSQHLCSRFKSFISENHHTWGFQVLIPQEQNSHTEINQLNVTAKIISQPGMQLCVASVALQSWQIDFMGCIRDFLGFYNIQVQPEHRSHLWFARD